MSRMGFVYLARGARGTFPALAEDIAALARPGDRVLVIEDSADRDTAARAAWWQADQAWGLGVAGQLIRTGTAAPGDLGIAVNLARGAFATPGGDGPPDLVTFWVAGSRIDRAAFAAFRDAVAAGRHDLGAYPLREWHLGWNRVIDPPEADAWPAKAGDTPAAQAGRIGTDVTRMILAWPLLARLRAAEGWADGGTLGLTWAALQGARAPLATATPLGHGPHRPDPTPALFAAIAALDPSAQPWARAALTPRLASLGPGARGALLSASTEPDLRAALTRPAAPAVTGRAQVRFYRAGAHAGRMPFAYPHLAPLWTETGEEVATPEAADLILYAHPRDLRAMPAVVADLAARRPLALFSEEPFWDSLRSPDPLAWRITVPAAHLGAARLHQVNHHLSPVYDFDRLPYFPLTAPGYAARYARAFARNAALTAADWADRMAQAPLATVFMAERRPEAFHDIALPAGDILGLCAWRTRLAEAMLTADPGGTRAFGSSWGEGPVRQDLPDWHQDKFDRLDGQARALSAVENTHQPAYLSEKLFDAFALGARPLYVASPGHRLHDLGLPEGSWVNLHGQTSQAAAVTVMGLARDAAFLAAYAQAQQVLARLWDDSVVTAERARLGAALRAELVRLADLGPA